MKEIKVGIDAEDLLNRAELELPGPLSIVLKQFLEDGVDELQEFLDSWCEANSETQLRRDAYKRIPIPWCEWFGVKERREC